MGALYNSDNGEDAGSAKVYRFNDNLDEWEQMGQDLDGDNDGDLFGSFVELSKDGLVIAVGGTDFDTNENKNAGIVRVFYYYAANDEWAKLGQDLVGEGAGTGETTSCVELSVCDISVGNSHVLLNCFDAPNR